MSLDATLRKFNAKAFEPVHQEIRVLEKEIAAFQAQKTKTNNLAVLALATLVFFSLKLTWNKLSGTEFKVAAFSSSSMLLGLFDLIIGGKTFWSLIDENAKAQRFAVQIASLVGKTTRTFYGEIAERSQDLVTSSEVLENMQENLKPLFKTPVQLEKDYILISTYQFSIVGDTADNFKCSSTKVGDNWKEVEATVAVWRSYYSEIYKAEPTSRNSTIMQIIASQCIQELPPITVLDGTSQYACCSPAVLNPRSGHIGHQYQSGATGTRSNFSCLSEFRKYLDSLPKVRLLSQVCVFDYVQ